MEKNILNTLQRDEAFAKIKPFLSSCPSKAWLMDHLTTFEPTPTSSRYCFCHGLTIYPITNTSWYNRKEQLHNDNFDRWVKAVNNGEFNIDALISEKKTPQSLVSLSFKEFPFTSGRGESCLKTLQH